MNGEKFELGDGFYLEAIHTPGHTDGSMSFLLKIQNVIKKEEVNNRKLVVIILPKMMIIPITIFLLVIQFL